MNYLMSIFIWNFVAVCMSPKLSSADKPVTLFANDACSTPVTRILLEIAHFCWHLSLTMPYHCEKLVFTHVIQIADFHWQLFLIVPYHSKNQFLLLLFKTADFRGHLLWILFTSIHKALHAFIYNDALS